MYNFSTNNNLLEILLNIQTLLYEALYKTENNEIANKNIRNYFNDNKDFAINSLIPYCKILNSKMYSKLLSDDLLQKSNFEIRKEFKEFTHKLISPAHSFNLEENLIKEENIINSNLVLKELKIKNTLNIYFDILDDMKQNDNLENINLKKSIYPHLIILFIENLFYVFEKQIETNNKEQSSFKDFIKENICLYEEFDNIKKSFEFVLDNIYKSLFNIKCSEKIF